MALRARDPAARQDRLLGLRGLCSVSPDRLRREHRWGTPPIGGGLGGFRDHRRSVAVALELVGRPPSGGSEALIFRLKPEATHYGEAGSHDAIDSLSCYRTPVLREMLGGSPGECLSRERWISGSTGSHHRSTQDSEIRCFV